MLLARHMLSLFMFYVMLHNLLKNLLYATASQVEEDEMGGPCSTNGGEEERLWIIGGKARGKETIRKTKT
jgi:hypothetical protein